MKSFKTLFIALISLAMLTACSFDGMYQKFVPDNVKALDAQYVDALMRKDKTPFLNLRGEMSEEDFDKAFVNVFEGVPDGEIIETSVAGFNHSASISAEGKSKTITSIFEIQKGEGYSLVTLNYALDNAGECCELVELNVSAHETSPVIAGMKSLGLVLKIIGFIVLISVSIGIFFIVRMMRKKSKSNQSSSAS